ncbi:beta-lactamase family protein [Cellulophaga sp. F20128]|uniref:serine hydrolase domain-containing protein n=1 Tax=Cellulophaga sp. F20128 TaxID=2926413 RepID=UPI001FF1F23F|nr:serine hydrolase [Cellulophaga sp. F20128]MCK0158352.1 beta-lactamase family protein [Cellulophaga sp. F20128]
MKVLHFAPILILFLSCFGCSTDTDTPDDVPETDALYFPPLDADTWETNSLAQLGWNEDKLQPLLDFLDAKNTKGFVVLYNGKIAIEHYMNEHSAQKIWYWASAGKTLTTAIAGIAQDEGLLNLNTKVSDYLGTGWTSATLDQENLITCKNLLSMTSGLDDSQGDGIAPENLQYRADAGTRWAYHNVYVKMQDVVALTSNQSWSAYFNSKLRDKIGMTGNWTTINDLSVYWSTTRSMARFGLLMAANGKWEDTQIIPKQFLTEATNTSQNINLAYGYLWWLNGKENYHLPQSQMQFNGNLIPDAPKDMYAALGKNDQKIYIVPSKNLVIIRMGNAADGDNFALSNFDNELWLKLNDVLN